MRRAHAILSLAKKMNLARWLLPWTVTREQWHSMSQPAISGIAVDTLMFSRIGVPLFHWYRVFDHQGTHRAFRGTYIRRMHTFLEESDAASLRRRHRRCARDIATRMSRRSILNAEDRTSDVLSRPKVYRRSISRARGSAKSPAVACSSRATGTVRPHCSEENLMAWEIDRRMRASHRWCQLTRRILFVQWTSLGRRLRVWIWMCCLLTTLRIL